MKEGVRLAVTVAEVDIGSKEKGTWLRAFIGMRLYGGGGLKKNGGWGVGLVVSAFIGWLLTCGERQQSIS